MFFPKNVIQKFWSAKIFSVPPKLGARSPPLNSSIQANKNLQQSYHTCKRLNPISSISNVKALFIVIHAKVRHTFLPVSQIAFYSRDLLIKFCLNLS